MARYKRRMSLCVGELREKRLILPSFQFAKIHFASSLPLEKLYDINFFGITLHSCSYTQAILTIWRMWNTHNQIGGLHSVRGDFAMEV